MVSKKDVEEFFQSEFKRLESERQARAREKGYAEFFTVPVGETRMTVKHQKPRGIEGKYGSRKVFRISVNSKDYDFTVNERSPLYRVLVRKLAEAKDDAEIILVRTGKGKMTKYDVREA